MKKETLLLCSEFFYLQQNLVMRLKNLLKHRQDSVRILALEALVVLAQKGQAQALFDGKVFFCFFVILCCFHLI